MIQKSIDQRLLENYAKSLTDLWESLDSHDTDDSSTTLDPHRGDYEIRNYHKLDKYLKELCDLVEQGQRSGKDFGMVAAGLLTLKHPYMSRLNRPGQDGRQHAEHAVLEDFRKKYGEIPEGSVLITTLSPCNKHMDEREGPACADLVNEAGIKKVYCGFLDPTQEKGSDDHRHYNLIETQDADLRKRCEEFAETFLDKIDESAAWQKSSGKNKNGGLNKKGVASYRRQHPGSHLQTAVTTKPSKLKKGSKASKRRASFCARMKGMKKHRTGSKTAHDPNSRINKSLRKWHCESLEEMRELIILGEQYIANLKLISEGGIGSLVWSGVKGLTRAEEEQLAMQTAKQVAQQSRSAMSDIASGAGNGAELKADPAYRREQRRLAQQKTAQQKVNDRVKAGYGEDDDIYPWLQQHENFADGKNPGRKGLAKRSGVNTKASVSSLRDTAKHSTGEKARMAHWLANMKAGKKKHKG